MGFDLKEKVIKNFREFENSLNGLAKGKDLALYRGSLPPQRLKKVSPEDVTPIDDKEFKDF